MDRRSCDRDIDLRQCSIGIIGRSLPLHDANVVAQEFNRVGRVVFPDSGNRRQTDRVVSRLVGESIINPLNQCLGNVAAGFQTRHANQGPVDAAIIDADAGTGIGGCDSIDQLDIEGIETRCRR